MIWSGSAADGSWGTQGNWNDSTSASVHAAPGLDAGFTAVDTATFDATGVGGTVRLDGANPSLAALALNDSAASYTLAQGSGGTLALNDGVGAATISVTGNHAISAPILLNSSASLSTAGSGDSLAISGNVGGSGGLSLAGPGTLVLSGSNSYGGGTIVNAGTLEVLSSSALPDGSSLTVGAGAASLFDPSTGGAPAVNNPALGASSEARVAAVPEPGTLALLCAAGIVVAVAAWRRRNGGSCFFGCGARMSRCARSPAFRRNSA